MKKLDPARWLIDTASGEYISMVTGRRYKPDTAKALIEKLAKTEGKKK